MLLEMYQHIVISLFKDRKMRLGHAHTSEKCLKKYSIAVLRGNYFKNLLGILLGFERLLQLFKDLKLLSATVVLKVGSLGRWFIV